MNDTPIKELGFKKSPRIINFIRQFSATEKAIFGVFVLAALISTVVMAEKINAAFMTEVPSHGGELHEGMIGLPRNINPVLAVTDTDRDIASLVYSGLLKWDGDTLVSDIARSYIVSKDGLTYAFLLRDDVKFQDGSNLTADDVAFTIHKIQDESLKSPRISDWANVAVEVAGPTEIRFILKKPYAPFITNTTVGILPKHIWETVSDDQFIYSHYNIDPIGSGPYKVSSIKNDSGGIPSTYTLATWSKYYGNEPYLTNIAFTFFGDEDKAITALDNGSIQSMATVSSSAAAKLAADKAEPYTVLSTPLPRIFGVFFNQSQSPVLADKIVRRALDMSVDRGAIVTKVLSGYGVAITDPLPIDISSSSPEDSIPDIAGAQALLEKNGWKKDPSTGVYAKKPAKGATQTIAFDIYTSDTPDLKQAAEIVKDSWTAMGASVNLRVFSANDLYQNVIRPRKYDALLFGELIGKDQDLYAFWHSSQIKAPGLNISLYANSAADKLLEDIRSTNDDAARTKKYAQFKDIISADIPVVPLYSPDFIYVVPKSLKDVSLQNVTVPSDRWNTISDWYMTTDNVWKYFAHKSNQ